MASSSSSISATPNPSPIASGRRRTKSASFPSSLDPSLLKQPRNHNRKVILKAQASEIAVDSPTNSKPAVSKKVDAKLSDVKDSVPANGSVPLVTKDSDVSGFLADVLDIIKLVDSKDIVELQLKKDDCELLVKKKEAFPPSPAPFVMMQSPQQVMPFQAPQHAASPPPAAAPAPSPPASGTPSPATTIKSAVPALISPMAGTFYRCPAPGEPPFVKVGDKVQKGQIVCIIEAMKLMNEIEADQSGTVVDIVAEDGKPVTVDSPLLVVQS